MVNDFSSQSNRSGKKFFRIFLCGDVMIGRGIDQILHIPSDPELYESYVTDARNYVYLAENTNGKIPYPVSMDYIWGDTITVWQELLPDIKIINLETAITQANQHWPGKEVHYRMHPDNVAVLTTAHIDICTLANNHILDWHYTGLKETLITLKNAGIQFSGAGENITQAIQPAIFDLGINKRAIIFAACSPSSGVPNNWKADVETPGVYYLSDLSLNQLESITKNINHYKRPGDLVLFSIHWGSNWGYEIPESFRIFAHHLIDDAKVDIVFGHSSHHPRPIEIYHNKVIFYGCGDFINDYEGINGYQDYRDDLSLMYFLDFDSTSLQFIKMALIPLQIKKFSLHRANSKDCRWLLQVLNRYSFNMQLQLEDQMLVYNN